jgi:hypothetical protein
MDLERFPLLGVPLLTYHHQILLIKDRESMMMQDQSQSRDTMSLS